MTARDDLAALAARVEAAEGADRELGGKIHGIPSAACCDWETVPAYTASLDAAASLVPRGWLWSAGLDWSNDARPVKMGAAVVSHPGGMSPSVGAEAATPALALCAAALRAMAELERMEARDGE